MNAIDRFRDTLVDATLASARAATTTYADETLYSFALYTSGESTYVFATVATEEALARTAAASIRSRKAKKDPADALARETAGLRWSPCDSPYHEELESHFAEAQEHLDAFWESVDDSPGARAAADRAVREAMFDALARVRDEGILSPTVVLNLLRGDQSDEERLANASRLDPPEVCARLASEFERSRGAV